MQGTTLEIFTRLMFRVFAYSRGLSPFPQQSEATQKTFDVVGVIPTQRTIHQMHADSVRGFGMPFPTRSADSASRLPRTPWTGHTTTGLAACARCTSGPYYFSASSCERQVWSLAATRCVLDRFGNILAMCGTPLRTSVWKPGTLGRSVVASPPSLDFEPNSWTELQDTGSKCMSTADSVWERARRRKFG